MSYENAPQTIMLATNCCCCGRPLCDAISVELGIGPECRGGNNGTLTEEQRRECNQLTHAAALAAQEGKIENVRWCSEAIRELGLPELADKVAHRFVNVERTTKITIRMEDGMLLVTTPYKRSMKEEFTAAWRNVPGRRWVSRKRCNAVPVSSKPHLWALLKRFFPGEFGKGPNGVFRVPAESKNAAA